MIGKGSGVPLCPKSDYAWCALSTRSADSGAKHLGGCSMKRINSVRGQGTWLKALGPGSLVLFLERLLCDLRFATSVSEPQLPPLQNTLNSISMQMWRRLPSDAWHVVSLCTLSHQVTVLRRSPLGVSAHRHLPLSSLCVGAHTCHLAFGKLRQEDLRFHASEAWVTW